MKRYNLYLDETLMAHVKALCCPETNQTVSDFVREALHKALFDMYFELTGLDKTQCYGDWNDKSPSACRKEVVTSEYTLGQFHAIKNYLDNEKNPISLHEDEDMAEIVYNKLVEKELERHPEKSKDEIENEGFSYDVIEAVYPSEGYVKAVPRLKKLFGIK
jgi:hypothetical protein